MSYRAFGPSYWLVLSATALGVALGLVTTFFVFLALALTKTTLEKSLIAVDSALAPETGKALGPSASLITPQDLGGQVRFSLLLYSLIGSLDSVQGFGVPQDLNSALPQGQTKPKWAKAELASQMTPWGLVVGSWGAHLPSFRLYLGEWRRLADDHRTPATAPLTGLALSSKVGNKAVRALLFPNPSYGKGLSPLRPTGPVSAKVKGYSSYLASSWVF